MLEDKSVINGFVVFLLGITLNACETKQTLSRQADHLYLAAVEAQENVFVMPGHYQPDICKRTLFWYLEYGDLTFGSNEYDKKQGGTYPIRQELKKTLEGNCLDKQREFQAPLLGKKGVLAYGYLLTLSKNPDGTILVQFDSLSDKELAKRNAKIIAYHIRTGQLKTEFISRNTN